jgi:FtsH-binding integral membrane protein
MIQRKQTLWFLLAAACGFAMSKLPLFSATLASNMPRELIATESLLLFALVIGLSCIALLCIFLFKNRPLQFKLAVTGIILSMGTIALEVYKIEEFKTANAITSGTYQWGGLLPIIMMIFFFLAAKAVYKDEKLVKSLDRLR